MLFPFRFRVLSPVVPALTYALVALNMLAFFATSNGLVVREAMVGRFALTHAEASLFRMLSSSFLHGDILHLGVNMWMLFLVGRATEGRLGPLRYLAVYFLGDLAGSALHLAVTAGGEDVPTLGASGAVMAVFGAAVYLFPFSRVSMFYWFSWIFVGTWEWRVWAAGLYYFSLDFLSGLATLGQSGGVANFAHLGGAAGGALVAALLRGRRDSAESGEAQSVLHDMEGDYRGLTRAQLARLAADDPDDYRLTLATLSADLGQGLPPQAKSVAAFVRQFPRIVSELPPQSYAGLVALLSGSSTPLPAFVLLETGKRLAQAGEVAAAATMFERAARSAAATDSELDEAWFRLAQVREMNRATRSEALRLYEEHVRRWPFSPFAGQALAGLERLRG